MREPSYTLLETLRASAKREHLCEGAISRAWAGE